MRHAAHAAHAARMLAAALLGGVVAGAVSGLGARLVMYAIRLMNPTRNGQVTHANAEVGRFTLEGTLGLVSEAVFYGLPGALVYLAVRRWMPGRGPLKGLAFGVFLLVVGGSVVLDGNYEYFRYVPTRISVSLFALLYLLYGLVLAPLVERVGGGAGGRPRNRMLATTGYVVLVLLFGWSLVRDVVVLRDVFHVFA